MPTAQSLPHSPTLRFPPVAPHPVRTMQRCGPAFTESRLQLGTVIIQTPASYVTTTQPYTGSSVVTAPFTYTTIPPDGSSPGKQENQPFPDHEADAVLRHCHHTSPSELCNVNTNGFKLYRLCVSRHHTSAYRTWGDRHNRSRGASISFECHLIVQLICGAIHNHDTSVDRQQQSNGTIYDDYSTDRHQYCTICHSLHSCSTIRHPDSSIYRLV